MIPCRIAKFKSANIFVSAALDQTAKFKDHQYFRLYGIALVRRIKGVLDCGVIAMATSLMIIHPSTVANEQAPCRMSPRDCGKIVPLPARDLPQ